MIAGDNGIHNVRSAHAVEETLRRLLELLQTKGITLFALIDHSGEASKAGMSMRPTKLVIFGNPRGGTPLMLAAPTCALDLPLKILIWEDREDAVWISYNSLDFLQARHGIPAELLGNIAVIDQIAIAIGKWSPPDLSKADS